MDKYVEGFGWVQQKDVFPLVQEIRYRISFALIPSHAEIHRIEMDDRLAKEAHQLERVNFLVIPCFLDYGK